MRTTITIRADESLRDALAERAQATGKTISELVREILEEALAERPLGPRIKHVRGRLELPRSCCVMDPRETRFAVQVPAIGKASLTRCAPISESRVVIWALSSGGCDG